MLKKEFFIILFVLLQTIGLIAQESRFKEGETLNVWAVSGLNMRDKPDAKATKVSTIPYGAKVVVQPNIGLKIPFEVEEFKGFIVKGYWLLVKYGNTEGFVFDGFLSRLPAPIVGKDTLGLVGYFEKKLGKIGGHFAYSSPPDNDENAIVNYSQEKVDEGRLCGYYQKYKKGVMYAIKCRDALSDFKFQISDATLYEGLFLIAKDYATYPSMDIKFDSKIKRISLNYTDENGCGNGITIKQIGNKIIVHAVGGC